MNYNKFFYFLLVTIGLLAASCNKNESDETNPAPFAKSEESVGFHLGKRLDNPYSVENMQRAYDSLLARGQINSTINITATHLYIKLTPQDSSELNLIMSDTTLNLFPYPLDYELIGEGEYSFINNSESELYTVIPIGHNMNGIPFSVLEYCFIPDDDAENINPDLAQIELESLKLTHNISAEELNELIPARCILPPKQYPQGSVEVYDTYEHTNVGVQGVKVLVSWFVKIASTYTNIDGSYSISTGFRYKTHYSAIFRNSRGFAVWSNWGPVIPAIHHVGRHDCAGYDIVIGTGSQAWPWATINNAACKYYDLICPHFGIPKPFEDGLRFWFLDIDPGDDGKGCTPMLRHLHPNAMDLRTFIINFLHPISEGQLTSIEAAVYVARFVTPDIFVVRHSISTVDLQSTVFHEMGHASHFTKVLSNYWFQYIQEICFHNFDYGEVYDGSNGRVGIGEMWGYYFEDTCHNYVFPNDIVQRTSYSWFRPEVLHDIDEYFDGIYTPYHFFSALEGDVTNHLQYMERLISKYGNTADINNLFNQYQNDLFVIH